MTIGDCDFTIYRRAIAVLVSHHTFQVTPFIQWHGRTIPDYHQTIIAKANGTGIKPGIEAAALTLGHAAFDRIDLWCVDINRGLLRMGTGHQHIQHTHTRHDQPVLLVSLQRVKQATVLLGFAQNIAHKLLCSAFCCRRWKVNVDRDTGCQHQYAAQQQ